MQKITSHSRLPAAKMCGINKHFNEENCIIAVKTTNNDAD
jgi:hypothetical protein